MIKVSLRGDRVIASHSYLHFPLSSSLSPSSVASVCLFTCLSCLIDSSALGEKAPIFFLYRSFVIISYSYPNFCLLNYLFLCLLTCLFWLIDSSAVEEKVVVMFLFSRISVLLFLVFTCASLSTLSGYLCLPLYLSVVLNWFFCCRGKGYCDSFVCRSSMLLFLILTCASVTAFTCVSLSLYLSVLFNWFFSYWGKVSFFVPPLYYFFIPELLFSLLPVPVCRLTCLSYLCKWVFYCYILTSFCLLCSFVSVSAFPRLLSAALLCLLTWLILLLWRNRLLYYFPLSFFHVITCY